MKSSLRCLLIQTKVTLQDLRKLSLGVYLLLLLRSVPSLNELAETLNIVPLESKLVVNTQSCFSQTSFYQIRNICKVLQGLGVKDSEFNKAWFVHIGNSPEEKNLRVFYLPLSALKKLLAEKSLAKIPDPLHNIIGVSYNPGLEAQGDIEGRPSTLIFKNRKNIDVSMSIDKKENLKVVNVDLIKGLCNSRLKTDFSEKEPVPSRTQGGGQTTQKQNIRIGHNKVMTNSVG